jgi:hypothetical protein
MKAGDLVRDTYGNIGVVFDVFDLARLDAPGPAVHVQFSPNSGYDGVGDTVWLEQWELELISSPNCSTADIANDPVNW